MEESTQWRIASVPGGIAAALLITPWSMFTGANLAMEALGAFLGIFIAFNIFAFFVKNP